MKSLQVSPDYHIARGQEHTYALRQNKPARLLCKHERSEDLDIYPVRDPLLLVLFQHVVHKRS